MYINGYFRLLFDLTPDLSASAGHTSKPENGNIRIELKFNKPITEVLSFLLYLEIVNSVFAYRNDRLLREREREREMGTWEILCKLSDAHSFH